MAFQYSHRTGGDSVIPIKEFPSTENKTYVKGYTAALSSGLITNGGAADTAIVGVVQETIATATTAGDPVKVILALSDVIFKVDYVAGSKTSLTDADIGTAFDLKSTALNKIDLDDTTDGAWVVVDYDNTAGVAWVKCLAAKKSLVVN